MNGAAVRQGGDAGSTLTEGSGVFAKPRADVIAAASDAVAASADPCFGGLSLARYTAVGALLRAFPRGEKSAVLVAIGLDVAIWEGAHTAWRDALRVSDEEGGDLTARWSEAFDAAWEDLQASPPTLADLQASRRPPAPPIATPTYLRVVPTPTAAAAVSERVPPPAAVPASSRACLLPPVNKAPAHLLGTLPTSGPSGPALPFRAPAPKVVPTPTLTLEQYASLCVELDRWPAARPAILARYQIANDVGLAALRVSWNDRLASDPSLFARWTPACERYRAWLDREGSAS